VTADFRYVPGGAVDRVGVGDLRLGVDAVEADEDAGQAGECLAGGFGRALGGQGAEEGDAEVAGVEAHRVEGGDDFAVAVVGGDAVVAREAALVDGARLVDEEVVADVAPVVGDRVELVYRAHGGGRVRVGVDGRGVVDREGLERVVRGRRVLRTVRLEAQ
jgi:hypothetical protein